MDEGEFPLRPDTFASEEAGIPPSSSAAGIQRGKAWLSKIFSAVNEEILDLAEQLGSKCGIDVDVVQDWLEIDEGIKQLEGGTLSIADAIDFVRPP